MRLQAGVPKEKASCALMWWRAEVYGKKVMEYGLQMAIRSQLTFLIQAHVEMKKRKIVSMILEWEGGIM